MSFQDKYPDLIATLMGEGVTRLTCKGHETSGVFVDYWATDKGGDPWRYKHSHTTEQQEFVGPFSHPAEEGCWIMAKRYFVDIGMIDTPEDNSHLNAMTTEMVREAQRNRNAIDRPIVGDIVVDRDGRERRLCIGYEDRAQTTTNMRNSYSLSRSGTAGYSGACGASVPFADLTQHSKRKAMFWVFKDGRAAAGNGVDVFLDTAVWTYAGSFAGEL